MSDELLTFANFQFEIRRVSMKVIVGGDVEEANRYVLNWKEYLDALEEKGIVVVASARQFISRYQTPRSDVNHFQKCYRLQEEIREILDWIAQSRSIPKPLWETVFREAAQLREAVRPESPCSGPITEDNIDRIIFQRHIQTDSYRTYLYGQFCEQLIQKLIFRFRKCPECGLYFMDGTKNRSKLYCSSRSCGNRAKQRAFYRRQREWRGGAVSPRQQPLDFEN